MPDTSDPNIPGDHAGADAADDPLRQRIGAALRDAVPPPSAQLELRVRALSGNEAAAAPPGARPGASWFRYALAAAAVIAVSLLLLPLMNDRLALAADSPISAEAAGQLLDVHEMCSALAAHGAKGAGIDLGPLPAPRANPGTGEQDDHDHPAPASQGAPSRGHAPPPDLSALGFELVGVKPCGAPHDWTAHALYRSRADSDRVLSLFIQPDIGESPLEPGRLYSVTISGRSPAIYAWRQGGRIVFLVGDEAQDGSRAALLVFESIR